MKTSEISKLLKENNLRAYSYKKYNDSYVVTTNNGKYFVSENKNNKYILDYLSTRSFNYYPKIILNDNYQITEYIEDLNVPNEQKINDLVDLIAILHNKTMYHKKIDNDEYIKIYEDLVNNYNYLFNYYNSLINIIDNSIFYSPANYLLARNISLIFESLNIGLNKLESWIEEVENQEKMRVCVINNDLSLSNYKRSDKPYLINWNKARIDIPIYDLYKFYNNEDNMDFNDVLIRYEKKFPLKKIEKDLLIILLFMPDKIDLNISEYEKCKNIRKIINKLLNAQKMNIEKVNLE